MSFGFTAIGDREQVAQQLKAIKDTDPYGDPLRDSVIDLLAEHVGLSELHGYKTASAGVLMRQQYIIEVSGHASPQTDLYLKVGVSSPYVPVVDHQDAETGDPAPDAG